MRSTVKKKKKKKTQSCCEACRVKSPKKCCESLSNLQGSGCTHANVVDQSQMSIALLKALVRHSLQFDTELIYTTRPLLRMQKKKKEKRKNRILQLFEIVSLLILQLTLNFQESVPACIRTEMAFKPVHVGAGCGEEGYFIGHLRTNTSVL